MKTYKLEVTVGSEGMNMKKYNDGFNIAEIIGFLELAKDDIIKQLSEDLPVDTIKRTAIID